MRELGWSFGLGCLMLLGCGDSGGSGGGASNGECTPDQISVFLPGSDVPECHPIPDACAGTAACAVQACAAAMYDYCPGANVGCSDLEGESTLVTCN